MPIEIPHQQSTFTKLARLTLALAAVVVGPLLAVLGADAATYCVGAPADCSGIEIPGNGGASAWGKETAGAGPQAHC